MERKFNIVEVATELADNAVVEMFCSMGESAIYEDNEEDILKYTKEAQLEFDLLYDYYYNFLYEVSIEP